ncbi:hypothetical protein GCM10022402_30640 [Salinactinospora qingdaonensis]|uniref:NADH-quinone oxidoreductase subunit N n=1 Tax=Salinactinospora qingdaonensis TaxID=702744 RepID=A0ABP7FWN0_9ACTN
MGVEVTSAAGLAALLPEAVVALTAVAGLLVGSWLPRGRQGWVRGLAVVAALGALAGAAGGLGGTPIALASGYAVDTATGVARVVVLVGVVVVLVLSADHVAGSRRESEFCVLVLLGGLGAMVVAGASDLLVLAVGVLLASVPLYALAGFGKDAGGTEAALKYYLVGALLGVVLLAGVTLLLGAGGATSYAELSVALPKAPAGVVTAGTVAVLAGLLFKAGAVPAHFWVPDVAEGASAPVAAFVTTVPKIGAVVAIYRLGTQLEVADVVAWPALVAVVAAASMTLGNLAAFFTGQVRRLLGYSTIAQVGYVLLAAAAAGQTGLALPGLLYYLAAYLVTNLGAFAVVCALPRAATPDDYAGLFRRRPWLALGLTVCLLGFVGTPPTAVFVGKLSVFAAGVDAGLAWLVVLAVANTVASLFYYLRWLRPVFRQVPLGSVSKPTVAEARSWPGEFTSPGRWSARVAVAAAVATLGVGVAAEAFLSGVQGARLLP